MILPSSSYFDRIVLIQCFKYYFDTFNVMFIVARFQNNIPRKGDDKLFLGNSVSQLNAMGSRFEKRVMTQITATDRDHYNTF